MADRSSQETHIEQVRELVVGPQMREYNTRLEQLEATLAHLQEEVQKRSSETNDSFSSEVNTVISSSDKKIRALDLKSSEDRAELRAQVERLEEKLTTRLDKLETELTAFQGESRKRLDAMQESFTSSLNSAVEAADKRTQSLAAKVQDDGTDTRKQAKRTEEKLETRFQSLNEEIESSAASTRNEIQQIHKSMKDGLQGLRKQLSDELNGRFRDVRDSKVSKDEISEILVEFGMRIKGMNLGGNVPQLLEPEIMDDER